MGKHLVKDFLEILSWVSRLAVKWLTDWQYLAQTAARGAVFGPLWKSLWQCLHCSLQDQNKSQNFEEEKNTDKVFKSSKVNPLDYDKF